ncbi:MAG: YvrJ family protein [Synergistaceae bacterium]|jgi:hypothetical protein|nr:YvrJ family protein [Synergistaceae bacterium]
METFIESTLQSGFSIVVSGFLLLRMEGELRALRGAIDRLRHCQVCCFSPLADEVAEVANAPLDKPVNKPVNKLIGSDVMP